MTVIDRLPVDCGTHGYINRFQLIRNPDRTKVAYEYTCCKVSKEKWKADIKCYDANTAWKNIVNDLTNLKWHDVRCSDGHALSYFRVFHNYDIAMRRYSFRCCKTNI